MRPLFRAIALCCAAALNATFAFAQQQAAPELSNTKVKVWSINGDGGYRAPKNTEYSGVRDRLKKRQVLEQYSKFLAPLRLPYTLYLYTSECEGTTSPHYDQDAHAINMCYQFIKVMENRADILLGIKREKPGFLPTDVGRDEILTGMFLAVIMHETGHAVFDLLNVPVFGREEDAADQMAAFIAVQFSPDVARTIMKGFAYFWATIDNPPAKAPEPNVLNPVATDPAAKCFNDPFCAYADEHGTASQRMYNTLCLAYGANSEIFRDFLASGWLPKDRAAQCKMEYARLAVAFAKTVYPFVDQEKMNAVLKIDWLKPEEMK